VSTVPAELPVARNRRRRPTPARFVASFFCLAIGFVYVFPLLWAISMSVRTNEDVFSGRILPRSFHLGNYSTAFSKYEMKTLFINTTIITAGTVVLSVSLAVLAAYGFSRYRSRISEGVFLVMLVGLMIPAAAVIIPFFVTMREFHLYDSLLAVIIGEAVFVLPLGILILRGYIDSIPLDLTDAARVDGASDFKAFWHVTFPLLKPAVATVALFTVVATWNGFLLPLVLLRDSERSTLTVGLARLLSQFGQIEIELVAAASVLTVLPVAVVFVAARRYYIQGLSAGAIKQ
jgi:ABC-type glycerol-3-phosphate transport system permease component